MTFISVKHCMNNLMHQPVQILIRLSSLREVGGQGNKISTSFILLSLIISFPTYILPHIFFGLRIQQVSLTCCYIESLIHLMLKVPILILG